MSQGKTQYAILNSSKSIVGIYKDLNDDFLLEKYKLINSNLIDNIYQNKAIL
jgi:hypothetical protein